MVASGSQSTLENAADEQEPHCNIHLAVMWIAYWSLDLLRFHPNDWHHYDSRNIDISFEALMKDNDVNADIN